jgi:hypothetical protein
VYETVLSYTLEIRDFSNRFVARWSKQARPERSRSRRRDCHLECPFFVPAKAPAGNYTLWVEIKDHTNLPPGAPVPEHRVARRSLDFRVTNSGLARAYAPANGAR